MICVGAVVMNGCSVLFSDGWSSSKRCIQRLQYSGAYKSGVLRECSIISSAAGGVGDGSHWWISTKATRPQYQYNIPTVALELVGRVPWIGLRARIY